MTWVLTVSSPLTPRRMVWVLRRTGTARAQWRQQGTPTSGEGVGVTAAKDLRQQDGGLETRSTLREKGLVLVSGVWAFICKEHRRTENC